MTKDDANRDVVDPGCTLRAQSAIDQRTIDVLYRRLDGGAMGATSKDTIKAVLHAAEVEFDTAYSGDTVICCDCMGRAIPSCDQAGHGLVTLHDLIETWSNP